MRKNQFLINLQVEGLVLAEFGKEILLWPFIEAVGWIESGSFVEGARR